MKSRSAKLLWAVLCITGVLLLELGAPAPGQSEEFWSGTVTANVNLRNAPSLKGTIIKGLLKGSPVKIYEEQDGWYRVSAQKYHQVFKGWVSIEFVAIATDEPSVGSPVAEVPAPEPQVQPQPPVEEPVQPEPVPVPILEAEKPHALPAPVEETTQPEPESRPPVTPEPAPEPQVVEKPTETKAVGPKPERPPRVEKRPAAEPVAAPADDWMHMLPMALPVVAVIVLLIAVIVYRVKRSSGKKAAQPDAQAAPEPDTWSTPLDDSEPELAENETFEDNLSPSLEEDTSTSFEDALRPIGGDGLSESLEEAVSPSFEDELEEPLEEDPSPALEEDLDDSFEKDLSPLLEEDSDEPQETESGQPLEEVLEEGIEFQMEDTPADPGDEGDHPTRGASVYDQVMEIVNRMSDAELTELLDLVNEQQGQKSRQDDRLTFYTTVDYVVEGQYYRDFIQDLSVTGVFIRARQMFEPGQSILMTFMSPYFQQPFKISGKIVRALDNGIGIKFDTESQVQAEAISALINQIRMLAGDI